ncbi:MAG: hypothetical protein IKC63_00210 [Clostridia bacterium]|nr:hypothetical protein [Clostridia bacterium]
MIDNTTIQAFELLPDPILICELDGTLIYKNPIAAKLLALPHLNCRIFSHLKKRAGMIFEHWEDRLPAFLEYESRHDIYTALVDTVYYETRTVALFFFSPMFDFSFMEKTKLLTPTALAESFSASKISNLAARSYSGEATRSPDFLRHQKAHRLFDHFFRAILHDIRAKSETCYCDVKTAIDVLNYAVEKIFSYFGVTVTFPILDERYPMGKIEFSPFVLLFSELLVTISELSAKSATISLCKEHTNLNFTIHALLRHDQPTVEEGSFDILEDKLPISALDLYTFKTLCRNQHYLFQFSLKTRTFTAELKVPNTEKYAIREQNTIDLESIYRKFDRFATLLEKNELFACLSQSQTLSGGPRT